MVRGALITLLLAGCGPDGAPPAECLDGPLVWAATTDLEVGANAASDAEGLHDRLSSLWPDTLVRVADGAALAIGRQQADAVREYAPGCFATPLRELPLPAGSNVHDLAEVGGRWLLTPYESDALLVLDPADGAELARIDVSAWADADGLPEPDQLVVDGDRAFAGLQALNREDGWSAGAGQVVEVDPVAAVVTAAWPVGPNPKLYAHPYSAPAMVVLTGVYELGDTGAPDGALSLLDPDTGALTVVVTEVELGFDLSDYAEVDGVGVVIGVDFALGSRSRLLCVDWSTGVRTDGPSLDSWLADVVAGPDGRAIVAARGGLVPGADSGLFALDPATCTIEGEWLHPALEPYSLAVLP